MRILKQNTGEKIVPIAKYHVYIYVTDTKDKFFLKSGTNCSSPSIPT